MASASGCAPAPAGPCSSGGASRGGSASLRRGRPYESLTGRSEIKEVRRVGTRRRAGGVTVITAPGRSGRPRVAVVAGRKLGSAVDRNRAKRRLREAVAVAPISDGYDYMVIASRAVLKAPFGDLVMWVRRAAGPEEN